MQKRCHNMKPSSCAADDRHLRNRRTTRLEEKGNPGEGPFLLDTNAPRQPRDIVIEEEVVVKIEVKKEPDEDRCLVAQVEILQENEPTEKRVKLEDEDMGEIVIVNEEIDIPMDFLNEGQEMEHATDDTKPLEMLEVVDGTLTSFCGPDFELNSPVDTLSIESGTASNDTDHATVSTYPSEIPSTCTSATCQNGYDGEEHHDLSQAKILDFFPEVITVYWEKYARFQPRNSQKLLNLECRRVCKPWKEGMDKVLAGKYTPLKNIHPTVMIPHGDVVRTVEVVHQVLEAYKNVDLSICPFPPKVLEIRDQNTTQTAEQTRLSRVTILKLINKFGQGLTEFKYYGIMGRTQLYQYTSAADWYLTVVLDWIGRMPYLEKLTMRNSLDSEFPFPNALFRRQDLSAELASYALLFPKLQNLKSFDRYLIPFSVITGALLINMDKSGSSANDPLLEMARVYFKSSTKLKSQEKQTKANNESFFLHCNRYDPSSI